MVRIIPYDPIAKLLISAAAGYTVLSLLDRHRRPIAKIPFFPIEGQAGVSAYIGRSKPFQAIFDSGADTFIINQKTAQKVDITRFSKLAKKEPYEGAGSTSATQFKTEGGYLVPLRLGPITINAEAWVTTHPFNLIPPGLFLPSYDIKFSDFSVTLLDKGSHDGIFLPYFVFEDERNLARRPVFKLDIGGSSGLTLVDSGAPNSWISKKVAHKIKIKRFPQPMPGIYLLPVKIGPIEYLTTFKPYPGELVILSMIDYMKMGGTLIMGDSGAFFS
jgi:hypothetical protein